MATGAGTAFESALNKFKAGLSPEHRREFSATTLKELRSVMAAIQDRQERNGTLQNMKRLSGFLAAVDSYSPVLDVFSNVHEIVAFVWVSSCVQCSNSASVLTEVGSYEAASSSEYRLWRNDRPRLSCVRLRVTSSTPSIAS